VKFIVDRNIRGAESGFGHHGELVMTEGRAIRREHLANADALIIRTATRVDEALLHGTPVGFVGTTSIGTDHLDIPWLVREGISWASAPGCNADSAAQYTLAMIWLACARQERKLEDLRVGIVGRGNVGSRVQRLLQALGVHTVANDPPLADRGETGLVSLEEALEQDVVTLHVPLTADGPHPTHGLMSASRMARIPDGSLLVNTARGDVVDGEALLRELQSGRLAAALDVWPGEPLIGSELLAATIVATPHVAGYSSDGKLRGTRMVYERFCNWADLDPQPEEDPPAGETSLTVGPDECALSRALEAACFVSLHDRQMKALVPLTAEKRKHAFDELRRNYPQRRDFHAWSVECADATDTQLLEALGFSANAGA
jgi:erythronate-4-phosphate dehydrogenase